MSNSLINLDAEQALLGSILYRDTLFYDLQDEISAEDFHDPRHRAIFRTIHKIASQGRGKFNATVLRDFLAGDKDAPEIKPEYLDILSESVSDPGDARNYARSIVDLSRRRRSIKAMEDGIARLKRVDPDIPLSEEIEDINGVILDASQMQSTSGKMLGELANDSYSHLEAVFERRKTVEVFSYPLAAINYCCGPAIPGDLIILGGRSGWGKSGIAGQIAVWWGSTAPGAIMSLEMTGKNWADRAISHQTKIAAMRLNRSQIATDDELDNIASAAKELAKLPVWIEARPRMTIEQIRAKAIGLKRRMGIRWLIVDHVHIVRESGRRRADHQDTVRYAAEELKSLAKELDIVVMALAQVNKEGRSRKTDRPMAGDLLYYGVLEQNSDTIFYVYRAEVGVAEKQPSNLDEDEYDKWRGQMGAVRDLAEIIQVKARNSRGMVSQSLMFNGELIQFYDSKPRDERPYQPELV